MVRIREEGWIPPSERTRHQRYLTDEFNERTPMYRSPIDVRDLPDRVIFAESIKQHLGIQMPRIWQTSGSCVGAGGDMAYLGAAFGDRLHRGDNELVQISFWLPTYGVGRQIAGMNGPGEGSFGAAQAKACEQFGLLPPGHTGVPKPRLVSGHWLKFDGRTEKQWSHPRAWPVQKSTLDPVAKPHAMGTVVRIQSTDQWRALLAQGYGVTLAGMFGTRPKVRDGVLVGEWNDRWAHQQSSSGYWLHPSLGLLFLIDNQWGPNGHNINCPFLEKYGVNGSYWITEATAQRILDSRDSEVFGHSNTGGFPGRAIKWSFVDRIKWT